jgi:hypothetical protein
MSVATPSAIMDSIRHNNRPAASFTATNTIDRHIFGALDTVGVKPAPPATDEQFLRRVTLDLTGRIPVRSRVESFVADQSADKRAKLVDELLATPEWVDKWTMFFGDLLRNSVNIGRQRAAQERDAMNAWVRASLQAGLPYDRMARELITAAGDDSWQDGRLGLLTRAGLAIQLEQDRIDLQVVDIVRPFLGLSHMDCILCHNGRGRLTDISLWGSQATRRQAWELSAFFGKTSMGLVAGEGGRAAPRPGPWFMRNDTTKAGYRLGTASGDRPARVGSGAVEPRYLNGKSPSASDDYRAFLARELTADPQFARAAVNYIWKEFFVLGIVEPADQFDLDRLDPDNPPPAPWTLQPTNARLLSDLAREFSASGFNLKALMRLIVNSSAYQLSSSYEGEWKPEFEPLFARKYVRRLWAEEIHDAVAQSSGIPSTFIAMQLAGGPTVGGPGGTPTGGAPVNPVVSFLDAFLRGNRVDQFRSGEFNLEQALRLMNNPFVLERTQLSEARLRLNDDGLVDDLFLSVLGRWPSEAERKASRELLQGGDRPVQASHLMWSLFNKLDFIYNY